MENSALLKIGYISWMMSLQLCSLSNIGLRNGIGVWLQTTMILPAWNKKLLIL
jgi:hypothetical protein